MPGRESGTVFRAASKEDVNDIAYILRTCLDFILPDLPPLHTPEEDVNFVTNVVMKECDVVVATDADKPIGFIAYKQDWISHLYIMPDHHRKGIGSELLSYATKTYPYLQLWTFQRNTQARGFYEKHGFRAITFTNGEGNEEKEPDVMYEWKRTTLPTVQ
jgi:ribosomal protein S18 acetylase RimI-like enzyme